MSKNFPYTLPIIDVIRHNYEQFRFNTYQYSHKGLYTDGDKVYAVISEAKDNTPLLYDLTDKYNKDRTAGIPSVIITDKTRNNFHTVALRNSFEKSSLIGQPMNTSRFINQLNIFIPQKYQPFYVDIAWGSNTFKLTFKQELLSDEKQDTQLLCESLGYQGYNYIFENDKKIKDYPGVVDFKASSSDLLELPASGFIQNQFPRDLLNKYEEDEDFWIQNRHAVFSGKHYLQRDKYLPNSFNEKKTQCFVDASVFERENLRVYLTLYEQVIIALPLKNESEYFYKIFKIKKFELLELIDRRRLLFVAPQNIVRYSQELLLDIISVNPNAIIFSRRLAASTIQGIQKKSGIIGLTFSSDEQYDFLNKCSLSTNRSLNQLANTLSKQWNFSEYAINKNGATSVFQSGLSNLATDIFKNRGKDLAIEFSSASSSFEFAQGLGAHHFPYDSEGYSEVNACNVISNLYNGVVQDSPKIKESELSSLLSEILTINNDMNVLELDDALAKSHIRSIPRIIGGYANLSEEEQQMKIYELRLELRQIENNNSKLAALDFAGYGLPALTGAGMEMLGLNGGGFVALGGWALKILTTYASNSNFAENPIFTKLSSMNHQTSHDAIIIKRIRNSVDLYSKI